MFAPLEAFLRSKDRCLFVLHDRAASVGWSAWLQGLANKGKACVFAGCDRLKMRVYLQCTLREPAVGIRDSRYRES